MAMTALHISAYVPVMHTVPPPYDLRLQPQATGGITVTHGAGSTGQDSGRYAVRLAGHLHPRWAARFDGMSLTHLDDGTTVLEGDITDQAALHGVLRTVRDLGLPLVSLTRLDESEPRATLSSDTSPGE